MTDISFDSGNADLNEKITEWLKWDKNEKTLNEIKDLVAAKKYSELSGLMMGRLAFGTAGLRARMQAGFKRMNDLVIVQTAQGLLRNLEKYCSARLDTTGIVIGYDGRYNSKRFAELTATVFLNAGKKVRMFSAVTPTPFVPFLVKKLELGCGIMVTASHNPKEDNGYKVYCWNGAQIISPEDKNIQKEIIVQKEPWADSWNTEVITDNKLFSNPLEKTYIDYLKWVKDSIPAKYFDLNKSMQDRIVFTYSAMHGVGTASILKVAELINAKLVLVKEQIDPDPEFPTVKFPNPEEPASLKIPIETADANGSFTIIANDPDADRLAVAQKNKETGVWKIFTGNEIGAFLGWWMLYLYEEKNPGANLQDVYMLASTVSSKILRTMARAKGFNFIETLTGFKWMGNEAFNLLKQGKTVIFAFEEAIGFMCGPSVLDKDGVSAAAHVCSLASFLESKGSSILEKLDEIWDEYGFHVTNNSYYISNNPKETDKMFERIRNINGPNEYPKNLSGGKYSIANVRDLTTGYDNSNPDNKATLPVNCSAHMITFTFENGMVATLRTSGTEPKIKYYTEMCAPPDMKDENEVKALSNEMVNFIVEEWFEPAKHGFQAQEK